MTKMIYEQATRDLVAAKNALRGRTSYEPALHCRYVSAHGEPCYEIAAVIKYPRWPVCKKHEHGSSAHHMRNFARHLQRRAEERGFPLEQAKLLDSAEREFDRTMRQWEVEYEWR